MINVNFGNPNISFVGFVNSVDLFGKPKHDADKLVHIPSPEIKSFPWPLQDNSVASAKLIYVLEQPGIDLLKTMQEIYRVCADGALIEVRARTPQYLKKYTGSDELAIDKNILKLFDKGYRQQVKDELNNEAVNKLDCNLRVISSYLTFSGEFMQRLQNNEYPTDDAFGEALQNDPTAIEYQTFVLGVYKDPHHNFTFTKIPGIAPFNLRVADDAAQESNSVSYNILSTGAYNINDTLLFTDLLSKQANVRLAKQQPVRVASIGADIGWFPLVAARLAPNVLVDAFEYDQDKLDVLNNNVALGTLEERVLVYPFALDKEKGVRKESVQSTESEINEGGIDFGADGQIILGSAENTEVEVATDSLDNVYAQMDKEGWPDFIIMNGHGYDQNIFDGAKTMFEQGFRPVIFCKFDPSKMKDPDNVTYYKDLVEKYGYKVYRIVSNKDANTPSGLTSVEVSYLEDSVTLMSNLDINLQGSYMNLLFACDNINN